MEYDERSSQAHPREYDWLILDLTQNIPGQYILIFLAVLINPNQYGCDRLQIWDPIISLLRGRYYNLYMLRRSVTACNT